MIEGSVFLNENNDMFYIVNIPVFHGSGYRESATDGVREG